MADETIASYKGIRIILNIRQTVEAGWTADFTLSEDQGDATIETPFHSRDTYTTRELAKETARDLARREIDRLRP